jgi:hypothetical protein
MAQNSYKISLVIRPTFQFAMEIESDSVIPFLDILIIREDMTLTTKVYRKSAHTG